MKPVIVWFRQDLRLADNPALYFAAQEKRPLVLLYILDTTVAKANQLGGAQRWWLHQSLTALQKQLPPHSLILRRGDPEKILLDIIQASGADAIFYNRCYEPESVARDQQLQKKFEKQGIAIQTFKANLLFEPWEIQSKQGSYFKRYSAFWRTCLQLGQSEKPLPTPHFKTFSGRITSEQLARWQLLPTHPDWSQGIQKTWQVGEKAAHAVLHQFIDKILPHYANERDRPDLQQTSRLSPYLHFGEMSPKQIVYALQNKRATKFIAELGWREFAYHLLYYFPQLPSAPFYAKYANHPWQPNRKFLHAWQQGKTGYPIIDAGMRQLWYSGWMHNRVRMLTASFLVKDLRQPWQQGEAWFWDTLVDADLANNSMNWQWVAGCGAEAMPIFRVFNPVLQAQKFDPEGDYIKRWVPELSRLPAKYIHQPWLAPSEILEKAGVCLGKHYPLPMIERTRVKTRTRSLKKA